MSSGYYRDIAVNAPDVVNLAPVLYSEPDGPVIDIEVCWSGDHAAGEAWLSKLRAFGKPKRDGIAPMPYVAIQSSGDELLAPRPVLLSENGNVDTAQG